MENKSNRSTNAEVVKQNRTSLPSWETVLGRWLARMSDHYRQSLSAISTDTYRELLSDLNTAELDAACRRAIQTSQFMPTVATIRNALRELKAREATPSTSIRFAEVPATEREFTAEDQKASDEFRKQLGITSKEKKIPVRNAYVPRHEAKAIEEQKRELKRKGYLK